MEDLKDCPFCGSTAETTGLLSEVDYGVECSACRAMLRYHDTQEAAIQAWNKRQDIDWISVKEKLPDTNQTVLIFEQGGEMNVATYLNTDKWEWKVYGNVRKYFFVTYWMPLPDRPECCCVCHKYSGTEECGKQ